MLYLDSQVLSEYDETIESMLAQHSTILGIILLPY